MFHLRCSEPPVAYFGLGPAKTADVTVRFPSGREATIRGVAAGAEVVVQELAVAKPDP